ncbi:hypothetical protein ACH0C8_07650 [Acetobacter lovaniensis]|uniref:hypothetical protein n=1 Tax=Acetobacter lovaniensis TaxID=104100 RepID=UPI0037704E87
MAGHVAFWHAVEWGRTKKAFGHGPWRVTWALNVLARAPILMAQVDVIRLHSVPG